MITGYINKCWGLEFINRVHTEQCVSVLIYCSCASCTWSHDGAGQVELISGFSEGCRFINIRGRSQWDCSHSVRAPVLRWPRPRLAAAGRRDLQMRLPSLDCLCRLGAWVSPGCAAAFTVTAGGGIPTQTGYVPANLEPDSFLQVRAVKLAPVPFEQKLPHWRAQGELQELQICCATVCLATETHALQF